MLRLEVYSASLEVDFAAEGRLPALIEFALVHSSFEIQLGLLAEY